MSGHGTLETGAVHTLRRVILLILLSVLVTITAIGVSGLLSLALDRERDLTFGSSGLAQSLSFTLIAAPFGGLVYWLVRRSLTTFGDRHSVLWPVYLAVMTTISLTVGASALLGMLAGLPRGDVDSDALVTGVVWLAVWAWHRWMWVSASQRPTRLPDVAPALSVIVGLAIGITGAIAALTELFAAAVDDSIIGGPWWEPVLGSLIWTAGGALIWWWHWTRGGIRRSTGGFARFVLVAVTGLASVGLALGGTAIVLFVIFDLVFGAQRGFWIGDPAADRLERLGDGLAMGLIGAALWAYHLGVVAGSSEVVRRSTRLVASGVALVMGASGFGVVINALLAALGDPIVESGSRSLLFGGLAALIVGGTAWWLLWRPLGQSDAAWSGFSGRRVYLVVVFGVSALVALVTLLIVAFNVLEAVLGDRSDAFLEEVRAPLGLLTATVLVAVYHFAVWRRDRPAVAAAQPRPRIDRVTLVANAGGDGLADAVREATGARVTRWTAAASTPGQAAPGEATPDAAAVVERLTEVAGAHVLVIARGDSIEVIPLADDGR
jgi:hypothetical protein